MIDIMIPIGRAYEPQNTNNQFEDYGELKYCLRAIESRMSGVGKIYLIFGSEDFPTWLNKDSVHIDFRMDLNRNEYKSRNIYNKILLQLTKTERFLFMNDDHFMINEFNAEYFPYFVDSKTLKQCAGLIRGETDYRKTIMNTVELLGEQALNYDLHCPIIYRRGEFLKAFDQVPMAKAHGFCLKSVYGNRIHQEALPVPLDDCKIYAVETMDRLLERLEGAPFFSTGDNVFGSSMRLLLEKLYPNKSKYEL